MVFPTRAYHGTRDVRSVMKSGLKRSRGISSQKYIYLTDSYEEAKKYSKDGVVEVMIPRSWIAVTEPSVESGWDVHGTWYLVQRDIPPKYIREMKK